MVHSATEQPLASIVNPLADPHINGDYLQRNPSWHVAYSPAKAALIQSMMERARIAPRAICEVGCGAGEVLRQLQLKLPAELGGKRPRVPPGWSPL